MKCTRCEADVERDIGCLGDSLCLKCGHAKYEERKKKCTEQFSIQYFIDKFTAIPESQWCVGYNTDHNGCHCAVGHCGVLKDGDLGTDESIALRCHVMHNNFNVFKVNDGKDERFKQPNPRDRMLAMLKECA